MFSPRCIGGIPRRLWRRGHGQSQYCHTDPPLPHVLTLHPPLPPPRHHALLPLLLLPPRPPPQQRFLPVEHGVGAMSNCIEKRDSKKMSTESIHMSTVPHGRVGKSDKSQCEFLLHWKTSNIIFVLTSPVNPKGSRTLHLNLLTPLNNLLTSLTHRLIRRVRGTLHLNDGCM